jgi:hypothetical protein
MFWDAVVAYFNILSAHLPAGTKETANIRFQWPSLRWTRHLLDASLQRCYYADVGTLFLRASQQMLRTHRSLEAYCATLWWRLLVFFVFPCNGAPVEWDWQGKTEVLGEKPVLVPLCPTQIPHGLTRDRTRASAVRGRRLTAWAMARHVGAITVSRNHSSKSNLYLDHTGPFSSGQHSTCSAPLDHAAFTFPAEVRQWRL